MGILLGLVAAFFWGTSDFLTRSATQRLGAYSTLFFSQFIGMVGLGVYLLGIGELQSTFASTTWQSWAWALLAVVLNISGSLALYRAFEIGTLTLVSPIAASYAAVTVLLSMFSGEALSQWHDMGIGIIFLGIIVVATPLVNITATRSFAREGTLALPWSRVSLQGAGWALLASLGYGSTFWLLGFHVTRDLGGITPVWLIRTLTPCFLVLGAPLLRQKFIWPRGASLLLIVLISVLDTLAYIAYTTGLLKGQISIITMMSSLYSAVTVLLAWIFLRERLQRSQWLGIGVIFLGIVLVNI